MPPLPPKKTVVDVFADFLRYLLDCSEAYIREAHPNGHNVWSGAKDDVHFVLSHPNGWEGKEQSQMRKAAVKAGLVPDNPGGHARISFVTEGEASLHFAIENGVLTQTMEVRDWFFHLAYLMKYLSRCRDMVWSLSMQAEGPSTSAPTNGLKRRRRERLPRSLCLSVTFETHSIFFELTFG